MTEQLSLVKFKNKIKFKNKQTKKKALIQK